ncbi:hypothetical protein [Ruegeria profundi]|uniref:Uncharacterized protein n=1 Tax=Ruegeria profundi TaxID=1685378 RepID=A0A0X3U1L2_9RHOB|nr:hypothetical protein [Ruegeria profundi]KUJ81847.1 hypothetical protein AVO44_00720 [Ruegeria profundi]
MDKITAMACAIGLTANFALADSKNTLPHVFELICDWSDDHLLESVGSLSGTPTLAYSSSSKPIKLDAAIQNNPIEQIGVGGTRHFLVPSMGPLAGLTITVFPDGRSVRTQVYNAFGDLSVQTSIGTCEVIE